LSNASTHCGIDFTPLLVSQACPPLCAFAVEGEKQAIGCKRENEKNQYLERRELRVLDPASGKELERLGHDDLVLAAAFNPDGTRIVTASLDKAVGARVWRVESSTQKLVQIAKARVPRCLTQVERAAYFLPAAPPVWCITGAGFEADKDPAKWQPKLTYQSPAWRAWLVARRRGENPPLPASP
jgi:hypothetical protein